MATNLDCKNVNQYTGNIFHSIW